MMEKITDKIAALPPDANFFSLEFFPPKTQMVGFALFTQRQWPLESDLTDEMPLSRALPTSKPVWSAWPRRSVRSSDRKSVV